MLFAVDMGNSNIVLGCMQGEEILFEERLSTNHGKTDLEYAIDLKNMLEMHGIKPEEITGSIVSSVEASASLNTVSVTVTGSISPIISQILLA